MLLQENLVQDEALQIQKEIVKLYNKDAKKDKFYKLFGIIDITYFFDKYKNVIEKNNLTIKLYYKFDEEKKKSTVFINDKKDKININLASNEIEIYNGINSLNHELIHVIDMLKSNLKSIQPTYQRAKDFVKKDSKLTGEIVINYYKDIKELNVLVNQILQLYKENKAFRKAINNTKNFEGLLKVIFNEVDVNIDKQLIKDKGFKKRLISRLYREGVLFKNIDTSFIDKVKKYLKNLID